MLKIYYKIIILPENLRIANKIKGKNRLDCIYYTDLFEGGYKGLDFFVNSKKYKGQLFFKKTPCNHFISADSKRMAEWSLTGNSINLSSIYIDDSKFPGIGYGYPNPNNLLKNGKPNPLFEFRNDGYLFIINKNYSEIELFIIPDGRNIIKSYYQRLLDGGFDSEINILRNRAKKFYSYEGLQ